MRTKVFFRRAVCPAIVAILLPTAMTAQQKDNKQEWAGVVSKVQGKCYLETDGQRSQIALESLKRIGLHAGDRVRCDENGLLLLELKGIKTTIEPSPKEEWTKIPQVSATRTDILAGPVDDWFELGGALRKSPNRVYSPPSGGYGSAVWPQRFLIRWVPVAGEDSVWLSISDLGGRRLWPSDDRKGAAVPASRGELASEDARRALVDYRKTGGHGPLYLALVDSEGNQDQVEFSIISENDERTLGDELRTCTNSGGLVQFICRAYYYRQFRLFTEAADEYDSALKIAPQSIDLKLHSIVAQRLTGNYKREEFLVHELPLGTKPPA